VSLVTLHEVSKVYRAGGAEPVTALHPTTFAIPAGEFLAVMGPSGSGKSTLLSILGVMNPPTSGRLVLDGIDAYALRQERQADLRREYIGFVFQRLELLPYLTALENVMLPLAIQKVRDKRGAALSALERVGLDGSHGRRLPGELSGGEQGRVAIARAIVNDPLLLLADEPTGSLDSASGRLILELLRSLADAGHAVVMVTHNPESVSAVDRVVEIRDGCCALGPPA
jgi:putative ABC transport system ATP-binding protein